MTIKEKAEFHRASKLYDMQDKMIKGSDPVINLDKE